MSHEPLDGLKALAFALREAGVSHYDGPVPGWPAIGSVKLVLGAEPSSAPTTDEQPTAPAKPRRPRTGYTQDELDAALNGHLAIHGKEAAG